MNLFPPASTHDVFLSVDKAGALWMTAETDRRAVRSKGAASPLPCRVMVDAGQFQCPSTVMSKLAASILVTLVMVGGPALAAAQVGTRPTDAQLLAAWHDANLRCRGSSDQRIIEVACAQREAIDVRLADRGYCYGKRGESGAQAVWHRCTPTSCGIVDC